MDEIVSKYSNIIDCDMTRIRFLKCTEKNGWYGTDLIATVKLTSYDTKIRHSYEKIKLKMVARKDKAVKMEKGIREYKCAGCGAGIHILEGSTCSHCGTPFDYTNYGWVIPSYQPKHQRLFLYRKIQLVMILIYVMILGISCLSGVMKMRNDSDKWKVDYEDYIREMEERNANE